MGRFVALACVLSLVAGPAASGAVTPKQASAAALAALKPGKGAAVYRLPAVLPVGARVSDGGPSGRFTVTKHGKGKGVTLTAKVPQTKLTSPGRLFWEDLKDGANFPHPSRLLLLDAATGKVVWTKSLNWWPLVNGKPAAFYVHSNRLAYRVTSGLQATAEFRGDCMIALVDGSDPRPYANFNGDAAAMLGLARQFHIPGEKATSTSELVAAMHKLVDVGKCKDVVLFIAGHGTPAEGPGATEEPTVLLSSHVTAGASGPALVVDDAVTASDLIDLVELYRSKAKFKFLINSCFSGRFVEELAPQPGVELVATASQADEVSYQAVEGDTIADHPDEAGSWVAGVTDEFRRILAGDEPNVEPQDAKDAKSDLVFALTLTTDHSGGADHAAAKDLTHPSSISHASSTGVPPEPKVSGIHAVFSPSPPGTKCHPPYCTTVYTVTTKGHRLTYAWSLEIPADPGCEKGFEASTPKPNQATWYHADESEGGPCNHAGSEYYPASFGHPGTVTVVVKDSYWTCTASFHGTQSDTGAPIADGPDAQCERSKK